MITQYFHVITIVSIWGRREVIGQLVGLGLFHSFVTLTGTAVGPLPKRTQKRPGLGVV